MSGGAEMIAGAVVQRVASMLGDVALERIELLWNFKEDVQEMKDKMVTLQVALNYAEKSSQETEDALVRLWLKKYKSVAYDMEDMLDGLKANEMIWRNNKCTAKLFFSSINPLVVRITMSSRMRDIRLKLKKIAKDQKKFPLQPLSSPAGLQDSKKKWAETFIGDRDEIEMIGREREKKDILTKVLQKDGDQERTIIPVVGLGGMGKTTLAKVVYTDKETNMFHVKAWVHVSMDFELSKIVSAIISQIEGSTPAKDADRQYLKSQLDRILCDKLYLIVLDDLWEEGSSNLEELMNMLQSGMKGSKIIVTTRSEKVASTLSNIHSSYFHTIEPITLEGMSTDECWSIMKPRNIGSDLLTDLVDIGKEIAERCRGVPLVAKALGYVMQKNRSREDWLEIKNSNILDSKDDDKGILKGLLLSYYHMPPHLKLCFMYFSIFPMSRDIDHDCLIQQWIALGFIQDSDGQQPLQKIGMKYVEEFLGMSFLTILTSPAVPTAGIFKPTLKLRMHDMVHELARHVAGDEFSYENGAVNRNTKRDKLNCLYHLLINHNASPSAYKSFPTKVRALHFRECNKLHLPKQAFAHTLYLRVLDLSGCPVPELPSSICKLKLLRYLDVSSLPISNLPKSLNYLLNLKTLIISNTSPKTLPTNIGCLQKLQYFDLSGCASLHELPTSFGDLTALLFLNLARCHDLQAVPKSFGNLCSLQFLSLSDCYKLHSLPESFCQLRDLTHFELSDCHNLEKLPDCIDQLSKLEHLNMTSCSKVQMLPESLCKLVMLKHLNLSFCVRLEHLPLRIGDLRLQSLDIQSCFSLSDLPDSIFNMSTLKNVEATFVDVEVEKIIESLNIQKSWELDGGSSDLWDQILELNKTPCHELKIQGLEMVKHLEGAEQAKLSNNSKLTKLFLTWELDEDSEGSERDEGVLAEHADATADKFLLEKLLPPRSLQYLKLDGYRNAAFPRWMLDIPSYLPHLTTIFLENLKGCNRLPPLGRLPNLRALSMVEMPNIKSVGREFYGEYGGCRKLRIIYLDSMDNLEEWWTTMSSNEEGEFLIPNLHLLYARDCPKLKFLPYPPRSMSWGLANSDHVLPERGFGNLSSTTSPFYLVIQYASPSVEAWRRTTQYLYSIEHLDLGYIWGLSTLPESIRCFTSLRQLHIEGCGDLEALPEWLGDLASLREIIIRRCRKLSSLPESIRSLTELKKLRIVMCPALSKKCQGEDKHKIAHIPEVKFE